MFLINFQFCGNVQGLIIAPVAIPLTTKRLKCFFFSESTAASSTPSLEFAETLLVKVDSNGWIEPAAEDFEERCLIFKLAKDTS